MTTKDRMSLLLEWHQQSVTFNRAHDEFCRLLGIEDLERCKLLKAAWKLHQAYTESVSALVGDKDNWLDWWFWDAKCGKGDVREAKAAAWDKMRPIKTIRDLCQLIEADLEVPNNG